MHIRVVFGLGLPILVLTAAVAYGPAAGIAKAPTFGPAGHAQAPVQTISGGAAAFLEAGKTVWDVPKQATLVVPVAADQVLNLAQSMVLGRTDFDPGPGQPSDSQNPSTNGNRLSDRPDTVISGPVGSAVKLRARVERARPAAEIQPKPKFKMPWQTGVFQ